MLGVITMVIFTRHRNTQIQISKTDNAVQTQVIHKKGDDLSWLLEAIKELLNEYE